jgi:dTMP kinase
MKGLFITLEGGEGSGKSTAINAINEYFLSRGYKTLVSREPGGIKIGEEIRSVILDKENTMMTPECETLLYAASRIQLLKEKIIPALNDGIVVILDRYIDSSFVYQGVARGVGIKNVERANGFALSYMPNITFFLDVRPEVGLKRLSGRDKMDRLDLESIDFHNKVYNGYLEVMGMYPERIKRIDGEQAPELVIKQITDVLDKVIKG